MGCGQSKIHLYPRKNKSKANGKKSGHNDDNDGDEEEGQNTDEHGRKDITFNEKEKFNDDDQLPNNTNDASNGEITIPILRNGPLLQSQEISSSQQNFFRMLDEKIEQGPDYDSASETEIALEEARLNSLIHHWESASISASVCSSNSRSLQGTPIRQVSLRQQLLAQQPKFALQQQQQQQQLIGLGVNSPNKRPDGTTIPIRPMPIQMSAQAALFNQTSYAALAGQPPQSTVPTLLSSLSSSSPAAVTQQMQQLPTSQQTRSTRTLPQEPPLPVAVTQQILPNMGPGSTATAMNYFSQQPPPQSYFGEALHPLQVQQNTSNNPPPEPRFPPAISVQRLAPQVQRQLRETQELIKDSTAQLYAAGYGSPGPPQMPMMRVQRSRRPPSTLETQYSQELS